MFLSPKFPYTTYSNFIAYFNPLGWIIGCASIMTFLISIAVALPALVDTIDLNNLFTIVT